VDAISKVYWCEDDHDRMVWIEDDRQEHTVKSGYNIMKKEDQEQPSEVFKLLWNLKVPPSAVVCVWRLLMDRLPTRSNLVKRGLQLPNLLCPFCQECVESAQRLFVTCKVTQKV